MYAIVIEQADNDPRIVVFNHYDGAHDFRLEYSRATGMAWDGDPLWHNYPREPLRVMQPDEALELLRLEVKEIKQTT